MSRCISWHGEYSDHVLNDEFTCARCNVLDEDALIEDRNQLRVALAERDATIARVRELHQSVNRYWVENDDLPGGMGWCIPSDEIRRALDAAP